MGTRTPLTGRKAKASAAVVKARKADVVARAQKANAARSENRAGALPICAVCRLWRAIGSAATRSMLKLLGEAAGQTRETRQRRGRAISERGRLRNSGNGTIPAPSLTKRSSVAGYCLGCPPYLGHDHGCTWLH